MAAKSKDSFDVYEWITHKVIPSMTNMYQIDTVTNLISNFEKTFPHQTLMVTVMYEKLDNQFKIK